MRTLLHLNSRDIARSISEHSSGIDLGPRSGVAVRAVTGSDSAFEAGRDDASSTAQAKPAILLIHARAFFRDCFAKCLQAAYGDHVILSFENIVSWLDSAEALVPTPSLAIIVIDPGDTSNLAELLEDMPESLPVIVVSDIEDADQIVRTLQRGARGYIPTNLPLSIAVEAVRLVGAGGVFVPASSFVHGKQPPTPDKSGEILTKRETAVVEEIRRGKANKQIACELGISEHTVKLHLRHIMKKLKARNRTEVAVLSRNVDGNRIR